MPLREQLSTVEKAIMAEEVLQDVPIREEDNIWDYLDGPSRFEMEELRARRVAQSLPRRGIEVADWGQVLDRIHPSVSEDMNEMMCESFTLTEIKEAVFRIGVFKALGPNGFQGVFFHTFWDIIGEEVNGLVDDFATRSEILRKLKSMHIVLIPKEVSMQKSSVSFGVNTSGELRNELVNILGMLQVQDPRKYLGIPTVWGGSKNEALAFVKDKVLAKIQGWKQGFLSQTDREVLIKAMVQAIPAYPMNIFCFPDNICNDIDATIAKF
ncbi:hypothetical protein ACFX2A_022689 [Malus domestica]